MEIFKLGVGKMLEDDGCSCDWRLDVERQARSSSGLSVVSGSRLSLASAPQCFPLTKRKGGGGKKLIQKVFHIGVLTYFVIPVLITVEKPPLWI